MTTVRAIIARFNLADHYVDRIMRDMEESVTSTKNTQTMQKRLTAVEAAALTQKAQQSYEARDYNVELDETLDIIKRCANERMTSAHLHDLHPRLRTELETLGYHVHCLGNSSAIKGRVVYVVRWDNHLVAQEPSL